MSSAFDLSLASPFSRKQRLVDGFFLLTAPRKARRNSGPAGKGRDMALNVSAPRARPRPSKIRPHAVNRCAIPREGAYRFGRGGGGHAVTFRPAKLRRSKMPTIGYVTKQSDGSYKGELKTLSIRNALETRPNPDIFRYPTKTVRAWWRGTRHRFRPAGHAHRPAELLANVANSPTHEVTGRSGSLKLSKHCAMTSRFGHRNKYHRRRL
jgi:hypothetical protein